MRSLDLAVMGPLKQFTGFVAQFMVVTRVCKDPPYKVEESGYAGFILPIEVYFKNKEEPKKVRFDYDLFLHVEGHPPVNHLRCEKLTFNNPTEEFRKKLLKAGGQRDPHKRFAEDPKVMVMQEGSTSLFGQSLQLPVLPSNAVSFSDTKKMKSSHGSKDLAKCSTLTTTTTNSSSSSSNSSSSKLHKSMKEHKDKPSKEHKSAFKEPSRELGKLTKDFKKPKENRPLKDDKPIPKMAFKEPKPMSKEFKSDTSFVHVGRMGGLQHNIKATNKRQPSGDSNELVTKKRKKSSLETMLKPLSSSSPPHRSSDKKQTKDKPQIRPAKLKIDSETPERKKPTLPPFEDFVDPNESDIEDNMSTKSESGQPSPASSSASSSSGSSFTPSQNTQVPDFICRKVVDVPAAAHTVLGPLRSIMQDLHSDDNEEDSEEEDDNDNDSDVERPMHVHMTHRNRRVSLSDGSGSDNSAASSPPAHREPPPLLKTSKNQIIEVKSPIKQTKPEKTIKNGDCDTDISGYYQRIGNSICTAVDRTRQKQAYLDELVELHRRLMTLRERHILQQIVNLIEETGHFHITNTTFDFDLCSLDKTTVRKLQSYLETSGTS
ncbi:protein AF-9-like isoform X1 [Acipenser oxyrinchus oxyrinchus]|uniref:Protein AF-9-like isoform X1 n=1 Tax=Acipenser oxyrinchus oxyrinchus TaxID=40147 RepID=A0AAD8LVP5_ACIOX|nr:protein AF-9-like isoform X1 [Acipenser oxyrinchus oxyrinchus]